MIELKHLTKTFEDSTAVDGIDLRIETGEFFGLLGPNGAGKTTTVSMLSTLLLPTSGEIRIDGELLTRKRQDLKRKVSVITQEYSMRQDMDMDEIMEYQGRLYFIPVKEIRSRTEALFSFAGLTEHRRKTIRKLSGGMDALSRRQMWNLLRRLNEQGLTILLTTHYIEEAQSLCHRVALMHRGRLDDVDTPAHLIEKLGAFAVDELRPDGVHSRYFTGREEAIQHLSGLHGTCTLRDTTLEDVFVEHSGRHLT